MAHSRVIDVLASSLRLSDHTAAPDISTLSLHDALPITDELGLHSGQDRQRSTAAGHRARGSAQCLDEHVTDRKSTRLNSSHRCNSYAVFCVKKQMQAAAVDADVQAPA